LGRGEDGAIVVIKTFFIFSWGNGVPRLRSGGEKDCETMGCRDYERGSGGNKYFFWLNEINDLVLLIIIIEG